MSISLRPFVARLFATVFAVGVALTAPRLNAASFTAGNLVVVRVGDGNATLASTGNSVFLDEFSPAGSLVQSVALPTAANGSNHPFILSGTATSEGGLSLSVDGKLLTLAGYNATAPFTGLTTSTGSSVNRVIAVVAATGAVDTSIALTDLASGSNPRAAITDDGTRFWAAGGAGGVRYVASPSATTSTQLSTTVVNLRNLGIFSGQLYVSDSSGTAVRLGAVGTGLPTSGGQTITNLPGFPVTGSPYGFFFADLDAGVVGDDTLYVADDSAGIQKFSLVSGSWVASGTIAATGVRGLTGTVSGSTVTLYATTGSALLKFVDATGYNVPASGSLTSVATAGTGTVFRGVAFAPQGGMTSVAPAVSSTTPANGAVGVSPSAPITVTFNEAVVVSGSWFGLTGSTTGTHSATVTGGPTTYTLTPDVAFGDGETVTLTIAASGVVDASTGLLHPAADYTATFSTPASVSIHAVQGSGITSPYAAQAVKVQGIVTATFQGAGGIGGFYVEAPSADWDADDATSEGIYVFDNADPVAVGDLVSVVGTVTEFGTSPATETELGSVTSVTTISTGNALPSPVAVSLPFASSTFAERYEGMLVTLPQTLTVTDTFNLGHYGELRLSNGRLPAPTNIVTPGADAQAQEAANLLNQVILDDASSTTYPSPTPYLNGGDDMTATRRSGSTTTGVTGIFGNKFSAYVVEPTTAPTFADANPRPAAPNPGGTLHVAIGNVLNFFNGDGAGGGFPTSRGADTYAEYQRQKAKMIAGILGLNADIMGLTEVENDGFGATSAIQDIVNGLNAAAPAGTTYAFVNPGVNAIGTDAITCALIYKTNLVEPVGAAAINNDSVFNRPPIAQTFRQIATGEKLTVCINHFKSKGSAPSSGDNVDQGDGQSAWNVLRTQQANALTAWLATHPTGDSDPDVLIIGDLNSYAKEDPIAAIEGAGYTNLTESYEGVGGYSYTFDGEFGHLDHALGSASLVAQVTGAATWHLNSDEPIYYDYNTENKTAAQQAINVGTPYRYSDHDPVVVGFNLGSKPVITVPPVAQTTTVGSSVTLSVTATGYPAPTYQWRKDGVAIDGATAASYTIASPHVSDSGSYDVVITNSFGSVTSDSFTLTVNPAPLSITLGNLEQLYNGSALSALVATSPLALPTSSYMVTYDGSTAEPIYPGAYAVSVTITDPDYTGSAADTLVIATTALVRHAPLLSGGLDGSLQLDLPENTTENGSAWISGDLLVPGRPAVIVGAKAVYGQTIDANLDSNATNYTVTLANGSVLSHVVRGVRPVSLPIVSAPPAPGPLATRSVTVSKSGQSIGDFATLRDLTLNGGVGLVAISPGTYGNFTANKSSGFVLGTSGAEQPAVYNFQSLTINSGAQIVVAGPVIVNLANGTTLSGNVGSAAHSEWLELNVAAGGVTLNSSVTLSAVVVVPNGTVTINGKATLIGRVSSDRLTINNNGLLEDAP